MFSHDESGFVTWAADGAARIWDADSGAQIGPELSHLIAVHVGPFSPDESRLPTWSMDGYARVWDVGWAMSTMPADDLAAEVCNTKLQGLESRASRTIFANDKETVIELNDASSRPLMRGLRRLDDDDVVAAPILRGREGEDVCV